MTTFLLKDIQVRFGNTIALDIEDQEIPINGVTLLTGPNGAGKTTLLRVMAGLLPPTRGVIRYGGETVSCGRMGLSHRRRVTLMAHDPFLFRRKVLANVAFGPLAHGMGRKEAAERALEALESIGCGHLADRSPNALSAGERRRIALARAIATGAQTLLLDEPTAEVDAENGKRLRELITFLAKLGKGIVVSTHQQEWAETHASCHLRLTYGKVVEFSREGSPT